eukprot:316780-Amphidinium_carterae.1
MSTAVQATHRAQLKVMKPSELHATKRLQLSCPKNVQWYYSGHNNYRPTEVIKTELLIMPKSLRTKTYKTACEDRTSVRSPVINKEFIQQLSETE